MDEGTEGQTHAMKLTVASCSFANAPKNVKKINARFYSDLFLSKPESNDTLILEGVFMEKCRHAAFHGSRMQ